ncbi:SCO7613 C-terminal domain-containing membrane protein [Modestobacter sp. Leaf380]|uniref:SCO7613 C-terminal domain-containing membrane protein n=1 Tax=Modestobacter sp. Leaf380 TaxID=1736356 RepID=UPI000ACE0493|nr:hypothetical protein [Modestobacter sp. Leaf380]
MSAPPRPSRPVPPLPYPVESYPPQVRAAPLRDRVTPQQLLLGGGAVAVVGTGLAALTVGNPLGVAVVVGLLLVCAALAVLAGHAGSRTAGEALALSAVASAGALVGVGATSAPDGPLAAATLSGFVAAAALALWPLSPQLRTWPVTAWVAGQVAVLVLVLDTGVSGVRAAAVLLTVAVTGLVVARLGSDAVAWTGLLGAVPWWVCGVVLAERVAWSGADPLPAAGLAVGAAVGLLLTASPDVPQLPTRGLVPVLSGLTAGTAVGGAALTGPPGWVLGAGFLGLGLAAVVAVAASRGPDWVPRDAGLTAAVTLTTLSCAGLGRAGRWGDLGLLLVATAAAAALLSARSRDTRPSTVPVTVGAAAAAVVLLTTTGPVSPSGVAVVLVAIAVTALGEAVVLAVVLPRRAASRVASWVRSRVGGRAARRPAPADVRDAFAARDTGRTAEPRLSLRRPAGDSPDERAAAPTATTGALVGALGVGTAASAGAWAVTAVLLAVLGLALMGHGDVTRERTTRVLGGLALVAAAWSAGAQLGWSAVEVVTVPAGVVLLAGDWRRLPHGASWAAWGPGLAVGLLPSVAWTLVDPTPLRQVLVLLAALVCVVGGLGGAVRAPFVLGLVAVVGVTVGWLLDGVPTPWLAALLVVGALLLALGAARERQRRRGERVPSRLRTFR